MHTLKFSFRSLWKNRVFTVLNIIGLAIGISASWVIFRICSYEYSYNKSFEEREKIFKVRSEFDFNGQSGNNEGIPRPLYSMIINEINGIDKVVPTFGYYVEFIKLPDIKKRFETTKYNKFYQTTSDFFDVFDFPFRVGNGQVLVNGNQIVISENFAYKYFGTKNFEEVLGQSIILNDRNMFYIGGVFGKPNKPTDIDAEVFLPIIDTNITNETLWAGENYSDQLYIKINDPSNLDFLTNSINSLASTRSDKYLKESGRNVKRWFGLTPLDEVHFMNIPQPVDQAHLMSRLGSDIRKANKNVLFVLIGVALFLMILAGVNYVNMAIANLPNKTKEIGLKKTLGVSNTKIFIDFVIETGIVFLLSTILSFGLTIFFYKQYSFLLPQGMTYYDDKVLFFSFLTGFILIVTLLSSLLPSYLMTKMQPNEILRNNISFNKKDYIVNLTKSMVVFQFFVASVFIISSLIINRQLQYILTMNLGFEKNAIVTLEVPLSSTEGQKISSLKKELLSNKHVLDVSISEPLLRQGKLNNFIQRIDYDKSKVIDLQMKLADPNLLKVYDLKLLAGRFLEEKDNYRKYVINEEASKQLGYETPKDAIGGMLKSSHSEDAIEIVGVVNNFNTLNVTEPYSPLGILHDSKFLLGCAIKLNPNSPDQWQNTLDNVKKSWLKFYPDLPFEFKFYDDTIEKTLTNERNMSKISNLATIITILLSCLGLFGLSLLLSHRRMKEISIKKVFGASISSIVFDMSKSFLLLVSIAVILAVPIVSYISTEFLSNYTFRILVSPLFYLTGLVVMVTIAFLTMLYNSLRAASRNPTEILK